MAELLATLEAPVYIERVALCDNKNIMRARRAVRHAIELQRDGKGFSFVEILSPCPTIWKMTPLEARKWVEEKMIPVFPLGVFRERKTALAENGGPPQRSVRDVLGLGGGVAAAKGSHATIERNLTIKVAGFGGQGVLLLGQILAEMGMREGLEVSWLPSYGPEMRSGSAHCHVCLSNERIGSPLIEHPDVLLAMNEISLRKFAPQVAQGGLVIYNRSELPAGFTVPQARVRCVPASEIADKLGASKVANAVMLGALVELTGAMPVETAMAVIQTMVKRTELLEFNRRALEAGRQAVRST
jgi:2-oxoisovalerate ferredoxin oxidoreductase beta subunit